MVEPVNVKTMWKKHKVAIITGVVSSIIATIILQCLQNAPAVGKTLIETINNLIYSIAPQMNELTITVMFIIIVLTSFVTFTISKIIEKWLNRNKKSERAHSEQLLEAQDDIEGMKRELDKMEKEKSKIEKKLRKLYARLVLLLVFLFVYLNTFIVFPAMINIKFRKDITIIKPYTDSHTIMLLESNWARTNSKSEYDKIYKIIYEIKEKNNIPQK